MHKKIILILSLFSLTSLFARAESCHPVVFAKQEILCLKKGLGVMKVNERALLIERRLEHIADNLSLEPNDISTIPEKGILNVNLGDYYIMSLRDGDFDYPTTETFEVASGKVVEKMKSVLNADRAAKGPETLIRGGIYTAIATLALIFVFALLSRLFPRIYRVIEDRGRKIPSLKIQNWEVLNSQRLVKFIIWLAQLSRTILTLLALYIYVPLVLSFFPATAPMAPTIFNFVAKPLRDMLHALVGFIPNFFIIFVIGVVTTYALKLVHFFFDEIEKGNIEFKGFYRDWAMPSYMLVRGLVIAFALVVIFPYIPGSDSSAFKGVSVFFGVLLSLGSSSSIANIVAGVVITYMRPFKMGDMVKINDTMGRVTERNLLVTRIRTNKNVDITVPNSMILGSHIVNFSNHADTEGLILTVRLDMGYEVPWQKVHKLLKEVARRTDDVLDTPEAFIWHTNLDDNYVSYELNAYTRNAPGMAKTKSDLLRNIQDVFHENGVELVSPHYTSVRDGNETTLPLEFRTLKES